MIDWQRLAITPDSTLREGIACIDAAGMQLALVLGADGRLSGVLTDGDVRRALLRGFDLTTPCSTVMNKTPVTASAGSTATELLSIMRSRVLHQIPLVDDDGRVVGLVTVDTLIGAVERSNWVVLMAGGLGQRLQPLTANCPKPMLSVGGKPILEGIIEAFAEHGFRRFFVSVNYMAAVVRDYFGDGSRWGVQIEYLEEDTRLGTAGALRLLPSRPQEPFFVMNGDLLTRVRFDSMLNFHLEHGAAATMAVREYDVQIPYGVIRMDGAVISAIEEKPVQKFYVNAGIYTLSPEVMDHVPSQSYFDMPELFQGLMESGRPAAAYPIHEYWLDVGRVEEFERAQQEWVARERSNR
jgi:dTDP-glucose pyrophosphorylase